jgi:uncharacterized protein YabE (DUF348 family)
MVYGYERTQHLVMLRLDEQSISVYTHQRTVGGLLQERGLKIVPPDTLFPSEDATLSPGDTIIIRRARPVWIEADGRVLLHRTLSQTVGELLRELALDTRPGDLVSLNQQEASAASALFPDPLATPMRYQNAPRLLIERAVSLTVLDSGVELVIRTTAKTVGEALWQAQIIVFLGDTVEPSLEKPALPGMRISLLRSRPLIILADGAMIKTRTQGKTVAAALAQEGIALAGQDRSEPPPETAMRDGLRVQVVRVAEERYIESEMLPHETVWQTDGDLEIDYQRIGQRGQDGVRKRRFCVTFENGQETSRVLERDWIAQEPQTRIIHYGTKIVLREVATPNGTQRYWRRLRAFATAYSPSTAGTPLDAPWFGITALGLRATKGIIAVDPRVIALTTRMYVPGYGVAIAGDTGGGIIGRWIDLCYDDDSLQPWAHWVDAYLLEPVPPADKIAWILPNWPVE